MMFMVMLWSLIISCP